MLIFLFLMIMILVFIIFMLFAFASKKFYSDHLMSSTFECGFTSYFFSRFSFSMHYFLVGLVFLFLDLELCYLLPFMNQDFSSIILFFYLMIFVKVLILGLIEEWMKGILDWKF